MQNSAPTRASLVRLALITAFAVLATMLVGATQARANAVLQDCNDNYQIDGNYSKQQLLDALAEVKTDVAEYSVCQDAINSALTQKITKNGSKSGGKSGKSGQSLKTASSEDLTTEAQREKIREQVEDETDAAKSRNGDSPIDAVTDPAIQTAAGNTLTSSDAPGVPWALILASLGLLLFVGVELAGRLGKMPRVTKHLPKIGRGDS
jgi:hypothetical protein